jgi:hypothetical protein
MLPSETGNTLALFESNLKRCIDQIARFRLENESLHRISGEMQKELAAAQYRDAHYTENKERIIQKLESLLHKIDALHIENIAND